MSKSNLFVALQFGCLIYFFLSGGVLVRNPYILIFQAIGMALIIWSVFMTNPFNWSIFPAPKSRGTLIVSGPFSVIRHPMYSGLLVVCFCLVLERWTMDSLIVFVLFTVNIIYKLSYEEKLLIERYPEYIAYQKRTKKLVPFIY